MSDFDLQFLNQSEATMLLPKRIAVAILVATLSTPAQSQTAKFDDLEVFSSPGTGYGLPGLIWTNFMVNTSPSRRGTPMDGCGAISSPNCAFNPYGLASSLSRSTAFDFTSAYFMGFANMRKGGYGAPVSLAVNGYFGGALLASQTLSLDPNNMLKYTFDYRAVDRVDFITDDNAGASWFLADDFAFNQSPPVMREMSDVSSVPEPATLWLTGSGLLGVLGMTARRRRSRA